MKNNLQNIRFFFLLSCIFCLSSCFGTKSGATKSAVTYYETFFVGEGKIQYYIKPLAFKSEEKKSENLEVDFTFQYKDELKDSVVVNFSLISESIYKTLDSVVIENDKGVAVLHSVSLMFNRPKGDIISRFTAKCSQQELADIVNSKNVMIVVTNNGVKKVFTPAKKTVKILKSLDENLFILF